MTEENVKILIPLKWFGDEPSTAGTQETKKDLPPDFVDDEVEKLLKDVDTLTAEELKELIKKQSAQLKKVKGVARERLHEVMDKKEKLKKIEDEKEAARVEELTKKEEFKKLYETANQALETEKQKTKTLAEEVTATTEFFTKELNGLKESLPTEYQGLVPQNIPVRDQILWIKNFKNTVINKQQTQASPPAKTGVGNAGTPPEPPKDKGQKATLAELIAQCKNVGELEALQRQYANANQ